MTAPDLARQLVEHPRWTWQPGMVDANGSVVVTVRDDEPLMAWYTDDRIDDVGDEWGTGAPPDIDHPATKGWLLHMLREATGANVGITSHLGWCPGIGNKWWEVSVLIGRRRRTFKAATEGDALAAALLAVWGAS